MCTKNAVAKKWLFLFHTSVMKLTTKVQLMWPQIIIISWADCGHWHTNTALRGENCLQEMICFRCDVASGGEERSSPVLPPSDMAWLSKRAAGIVSNQAPPPQSPHSFCSFSNLEEMLHFHQISGAFDTLHQETSPVCLVQLRGRTQVYNLGWILQTNNK